MAHKMSRETGYAYDIEKSLENHFYIIVYR